MALVLSIDLAYTKLRDFGICLIEERQGRLARVNLVSPAELKLEEPPEARQCAQAVSAYCRDRGVKIVFLDGPQAWKDPGSTLEYSRVCERILNAPAKIGIPGQVKPKPYKPFVEFSIALFRHLVNLGGLLVSDPVVTTPRDRRLLVVESLPLSAWRKLGIKPLPGKARAKRSDIQNRLQDLQRRFGSCIECEPTHDELQALVAGVAGVAILAGDPNGYIAEGVPPKEVDGNLVEGFIVNPRRPSPKVDVTAPNGPRTTGKGTPSSGNRARPVYPDPATLEKMLYYLKITREAEYRIERVLYRQGKIVGGVYVGRGQEAIGVGSAIQMVDGDVVLPSHRDFSSFLIRGITLRQIFCNWMARANAPARGRDNTLHIGDLSKGIIPIISPLGDTLPVACGVALAFKQRRKNNVALVHFGEGTTSRGDVHEAMNLAAVMKLGVIFICNNNAYAYSTPTEKQYAVENLSLRGAAYGMPGITTDGNDVLGVHATVKQAIERARAGEGPSFIECKTFRLTGHSAHDAAEYVPREMLQKQAGNDPILRLVDFLLAQRLITRARIREIEQRIQREIDDAVAYAEASPLPAGEEALEGVYCAPHCWWES